MLVYLLFYFSWWSWKYSFACNSEAIITALQVALEFWVNFKAPNTRYRPTRATAYHALPPITQYRPSRASRVTAFHLLKISMSERTFLVGLPFWLVFRGWVRLIKVWQALSDPHSQRILVLLRLQSIFWPAFSTHSCLIAFAVQFLTRILNAFLSYCVCSPFSDPHSQHILLLLCLESIFWPAFSIF